MSLQKKSINKLCLIMIVKNESKIIKRCIDACKGIIDAVCITDTGSSDNTVSLIKEVCNENNLEPKIFESKWLNFGHNRTESFKNAKSWLLEKYNNKIDWGKNKSNIIGFDIDENVRNMALLNIFLECGELCNETIVKQDTLHCDLRFSSGIVLEKAKIILANEPMGIKNIKFATEKNNIQEVFYNELSDYDIEQLRAEAEADDTMRAPKPFIVETVNDNDLDNQLLSL